MRERRAAARNICLTLILIAPLLLASGCSPKTFWWNSRYQKVLGKAYTAERGNDLDRADRLFRKARRVHPERSRPAFAHAVVLARQERTAEAWEMLDEAVRAGYDDAYVLETERSLAPFRDDPRFEEILSRVRANAVQRREEMQRAHEAVAWESAPPYGSYAELTDDFGKQSKRLGKRRHALTYDELGLLERRLRMRKLAALERYMEEHPAASDREAAALAYVRQHVLRAEGSFLPWERTTSAEFGRAAGRFIADYPDSENGREVALYRAVAPVVGTRPEDHEWETDPEPRLGCDGAVERLEPLIVPGATDRWTAAALGFKALCMFETEPDGKESIRDALAAYSEIPEPGWEDWYPFRFSMQRRMKILSFRLNGPPPFTAATLNGEEMSLDTLRGKVVLMEFWAPG